MTEPSGAMGLVRDDAHVIDRLMAQTCCHCPVCMAHFSGTHQRSCEDFEAAPDATILPFPEIWTEVAAERERAHRKHGPTSMEQQPVDSLDRLAILTEEVGEVARVFNEVRHRGHWTHADLVELRSELVQVAAMAGAWAAGITRFTGPVQKAGGERG